jgi:ppGpp synthetase/RelA/SpoT-type nucleotidyltranferase
MNFQEYQNGGNELYRTLAKAVRDILEAAAEDRSDVPRVQAYQSREKGIESLKRKLTNRGKLDAPDIGAEIKDLAGARVILYTNIDYNRYLRSRLVVEALHVHWPDTKAHYPNDENNGTRYEGFHYVVSLHDGLTASEEYAALKGLRCEVQVQTLLAHAFAEASHDIIYKSDLAPGFGSTARKDMIDRLNRTADDHLRKAGYELDKVQADYKNLSRGLELLDRRELNALAACADNTERYERLRAVQDYLLPHYDDIGAVIGEVHRALVDTAADARKSEREARTIGGAEIKGLDADIVVRRVIDILTELRYVDVVESVSSFIALYKSETGDESRQQILGGVKKLASYDLQAWQQVGPGIQLYLGDLLAKMNDAEIDEIRPLAISIWRCLLSSEVDGTFWSGDTVTISKGAIPINDSIKEMRATSIKGLTGLFDRSSNEGQRGSVISAFWDAAQLPHQANYSNELLATVVHDMTEIAGILLSRLANLGYDEWQHIESRLFQEYKRFKPLAEANNDAKGVKTEAQKLVATIKDVRTRMNRTKNYVRYKTLVGFEGVFSWQWDQEGIDFVKIERFRKERAARFASQVNHGNADKWLEFIRRCAATKSNDMATFPIFSGFLLLLGENQPGIAIRAIDSGNSDILKFLPALLTGLSKSSAQADYQRIVGDFVKGGQHLSSIARSLRFKDQVTVEETEALLAQSMRVEDELAIIECLASAVFNFPKIGRSVVDNIFLPALSWLTERCDARWVREVWFSQQLAEFFDCLNSEQAQAILTNLLNTRKIGHEVERILTIIASRHVGLVWVYFRNRLMGMSADGSGNNEAVPYQLHELSHVLAVDPLSAVRELRKWFEAGDNMFQFTGGRLLHSTFRQFTPELANAVLEVCKAWTSEDVDFALQALHIYSCEPTTHAVMKAIVSAVAEDDERLGCVLMLVESTGAVRGEYGMAEALRERKALVTKWLEHAHPKVRGFVEIAMRRLDNRIAAETRDADLRKERRKRDTG